MDRYYTGTFSQNYSQNGKELVNYTSKVEYDNDTFKITEKDYISGKSKVTELPNESFDLFTNMFNSGPVRHKEHLIDRLERQYNITENDIHTPFKNFSRNPIGMDSSLFFKDLFNDHTPSFSALKSKRRGRGKGVVSKKKMRKPSSALALKRKQSAKKRKN